MIFIIIFRPFQRSATTVTFINVELLFLKTNGNLRLALPSVRSSNIWKLSGNLCRPEQYSFTRANLFSLSRIRPFVYHLNLLKMAWKVVKDVFCEYVNESDLMATISSSNSAAENLFVRICHYIVHGFLHWRIRFGSNWGGNNFTALYPGYVKFRVLFRVSSWEHT